MRKSTVGVFLGLVLLVGAVPAPSPAYAEDADLVPLGTIAQLFPDAALASLVEVQIVEGYDGFYLNGVPVPPLNGSGTQVTARQLASITSLDATEAPAQVASLTGIKRLTGLKELNLTGHRLVSVPDESFAGLSKLTTLILDCEEDRKHSNRYRPAMSTLKSLGANAFAGLASLRRLSIQNQSLTWLPEDVFAGMGALEQLDLSGNRIKSLPSTAFAGLRNMKLLDVGNNLISKFPDKLFSPLTYVGNNYATSKCFEQWPTDASLRVSRCGILIDDNPLLALNWKAFSGLKRLTAVQYLWAAREPIAAQPSGSWRVWVKQKSSWKWRIAPMTWANRALRGVVPEAPITGTMFKFKSSNTRVATVDAKGVVRTKAVKKNTKVRITATAIARPYRCVLKNVTWPSSYGGYGTGCGDHTFAVDLLVTQKTSPVKSVKVGMGSTLKLTQQHTQIWVDVAKATNPVVSFSSSKKAVATVDANGHVIARAKGKTTITVKVTAGGKTKKVKKTLTVK